MGLAFSVRGYAGLFHGPAFKPVTGITTQVEV